MSVLALSNYLTTKNELVAFDTICKLEVVTIINVFIYTFMLFIVNLT